MAKINMIDGESLARALTSMGLSVTFSGHEVSPSSILYNFDLTNPLDYTKVKKIATCLTTVIHKSIKVVNSKNSSFCFSIPRDKRDFPNFKAYHNALAGKPAGEILFGIDEQGQAKTRNIRDTKSILVGGASGGGKSVLLSNIICSLICYSKPSECGLVLIDLKRCEFELFKNSSHLTTPVQFEYEGAYKTLCNVKKEIENRYISMQQQGIRKATVDKYPLLITIIDEYAELARHSNKSELDDIVSSIASTGRACNVFIIIATQHAISTIISNTIKSNLQTRIGLRTTNIAQSSCILGVRDCFDLLGYGDSYITFDGVAGLQRVQCCYIDEDDINGILKTQNENARAKYEGKMLAEKHGKAPKSKFKAWLIKLSNRAREQAGYPKITYEPQPPIMDSELNLINCVIDNDDED